VHAAEQEVDAALCRTRSLPRCRRLHASVCTVNSIDQNDGRWSATWKCIRARMPVGMTRRGGILCTPSPPLCDRLSFTAHLQHFSPCTSISTSYSVQPAWPFLSILSAMQLLCPGIAAAIRALSSPISPPHCGSCLFHRPSAAAASALGLWASPLNR